MNDVLDKTSECCANCAIAIPSNGEVWCDIHDHRIIDPINYRCPDFERYDGEEHEDSLRQEGLI